MARLFMGVISTEMGRITHEICEFWGIWHGRFIWIYESGNTNRVITPFIKLSTCTSLESWIYAWMTIYYFILAPNLWVFWHLTLTFVGSLFFTVIFIFFQVQAICQYGDNRLKSEKSSIYITTYPLPRGAERGETVSFGLDRIMNSCRDNIFCCTSFAINTPFLGFLVPRTLFPLRKATKGRNPPCCEGVNKNTMLIAKVINICHGMHCYLAGLELMVVTMGQNRGSQENWVTIYTAEMQLPPTWQSLDFLWMQTMYPLKLICVMQLVAFTRDWNPSALVHACHKFIHL